MDPAARCAVDGEGRPYITLDFIRAMIEEFKAERLIHRRYAFQVCGCMCVCVACGAVRYRGPPQPSARIRSGLCSLCRWMPHLPPNVHPPTHTHTSCATSRACMRRALPGPTLLTSAPPPAPPAADHSGGAGAAQGAALPGGHLGAGGRPHHSLRGHPRPGGARVGVLSGLWGVSMWERTCARGWVGCVCGGD